ncbi:MAG: polar amino acid transport system substrate-binding protein [Gaiellaceae bacterium]|nr:polar amino acid transport system substrate-binding protein [Gaiellaceae bacterium]
MRTDAHDTKYRRGRVAFVRRAPAILLVTLLSILAAGCGGSSNKASTDTTATAASGSCDKGSLNLVNSGQPPAGTDTPAHPPWIGGNEKAPWKLSDPRSGQGYESAVAYAVAKQLGFAKSEVKWIVVPFNTSFAPGPKKFDFDVNQISFKPVRAKTVSFSDSYYDLNQALVVVKGTPIASAKSVADLKPYKFGAQLGTTSYDYIKQNIKPSKQPAVFDTNDAAVQSLKNKQIDGLVVDLPTAFYISAVQVPKGEILGQFPTVGTKEHFGMVFEKGNSLVGCVNDALAKLRDAGTLASLQSQWLAKAAGAPVLK